MTLVELVTALAIAAAALAIGVPSLRRNADARRLDGAATTMFSTLALARSEAIKRNGPVVVCKSADGIGCTDTGGWEQGWILFQDANNNALFDDGEALIQKEQAIGPGVRFTGNLHVARYISFSAVGAPRTVGGAFQAGTLTACQDLVAAAVVRQVTLSATGRARLGKVGSGECR